MADIGINIVAWFTPKFVEVREKGQVFNAAMCRVCGKEITRHISYEDLDALMPEELAKAREETKRDGETFFAHLYTAHRDYFGEDPNKTFIEN